MAKKDEVMQYNTEADVETKYVYTVLLRDILEIESELVSFHVPVKITQGRKVVTKEADVVIKNKSGETVLVIDSKSPTEDLEDYFNQIDSYAFYLEAPISILTNYHRMVVRAYLSGNKKEVILDEDIDSLTKDKYSKFKELIETYDIRNSTNHKVVSKREKNKITDYRRMFRQIHTKIRSIDKLDPSAAFDEFSKILFIKIINDIVTEEERLTVDRIEAFGTVKSKTEYIDKWFQEMVKKHYPGIFADNEKISVSPNTLIAIINILNEEFKLKDSLADIKGRAFEEFLPSQLRGKGLGQFFTPRPVVDFMIELADIKVSDKVMDFASGSGGFLIKAFDRKKQLIESMQNQYLDYIGKTKEELLEETKTQIFGIDAEPRAVRTAKMNMLLWGDGKQIQHGNGLDTRDYARNPYFAKEYDKNDKNSGVDVILANPPFGSIEEDQEILKRYKLSKNKKLKDGTVEKAKEKTENLFVEKAYKMLKPGGRLLIVLPEGIFSNGDSRTRDFIISHFAIDTVVKLPKHAFVMSGVDTINCVILIAVKNSEERQNKIKISQKNTWINAKVPMKINFASVNQIGYEPSGKIIFDGYENSDLKIISNKILTDNVSTILADPFEYASLEFGSDDKIESWKKSMVKFLQIEFKEVPKRLDPTYYFFNEETEDILRNFVNLPITEENVEKIKLTEEELNEDVEKIYKYVSVVKTIDGCITETEEKTVDDILSTQKSSIPQKLFKDDIVFNPYRINTGSIIYINSKEKNLITSPAYIVLRNIDMNIEYLVHLLKTPFMKYQIQVLASGSVRDNFSASDLFNLKIPKVSKEEQSSKVMSVKKSVKAVRSLEKKINKQIEIIDHELIDFRS